eukprot:4519571-Pleurochrysis_carterae.AAC.3
MPGKLPLHESRLPLPGLGFPNALPRVSTDAELFISLPDLERATSLLPGLPLVSLCALPLSLVTLLLVRRRRPGQRWRYLGCRAQEDDGQIGQFINRRRGEFGGSRTELARLVEGALARSRISTCRAQQLAELSPPDGTETRRALRE